MLKGLKVTIKTLFSPAKTVQYPKEKLELSFWRGYFTLEVENCIACGLCYSECPNKPVINLQISKNPETKKNQLDGYIMDLTYCTYCGLCVQVCPTKVLRFKKAYEYSAYTREALRVDLMQEYYDRTLASGVSLHQVDEEIKKAVKKKPADDQEDKDGN